MADRLNSVLNISNVPFFQRPIGSSDNDIQVGFDELGNAVYKTMTGQQYTVSLAEDQRTSNQKIREDVIPAVTEYAKDPFLPSFDQVLDVGKAAAKGFWDIISLPGDVLSGKREEAVTYGDIADLSGFMVGGSAFGSRPKGSLGMFLGLKNKGFDKEKFETAKKMRKEGASPDEIWRETQTDFIGKRPFQEFDDSRSVIANTRMDKPADNFDEPPLTKSNISKQVDNNKLKDLKITKKASENEIFMLLQTGQITTETAKKRLAKLDADYKAAINTTDEVVPAPEVTDTSTKSAYTNRPLLKRGPLDKVLNHPELYDYIDPDLMPTAQAGFQAQPKNSGYVGVYYPYNRLDDGTKIPQKNLKNKESQINAYKRLDSDNEWSTTLHEVQHYLQDVGDELATGSNTAKAHYAINRIIRRNEKQRDAIFVEDGGNQQTFELEMILDRVGGVRYKGTTFKPVFIKHKRFVEMLSSIDELAATVDPTNYKSSLSNKLKEIFPKIKNTDEVVDELLSSPSIMTLVEKVRYAKSPTPGLLGRVNDFETTQNIVNLKNMPVKDQESLLGMDLVSFVYRANLGEAMARLTQNRRNLTNAERVARRPSLDLDVDPEFLMWDDVSLIGSGINKPPKATPNLSTTDEYWGGLMNPPKLEVSNPGGDWLERKLKKAKKERDEASPNTFTANFGNSEGNTAWLDKSIMLEPQMLAGIKGASFEELYRPDPSKIDALRKSIKEKGYLSSPVRIYVREDGVPFVAEGNHRIIEALESNRETIPVDIMYFRGAENIDDGIFSPSNLGVLR